MKGDLVSVIVPVYNVEKNLNYSINSLLNQTYKNLEIILVDDGSTDNSGKICEDYAKKDSRVKVFHKTNGGAASARNYGVHQATSDKIVFLDSDDYYNVFAIDYMVLIYKKYGADLVLTSIAGTKEYTSGYNRKLTLQDIKNVRNLSVEELLEEMYYGKTFGVHAGSKLYNKNLLLDNPYTEGKIHEDTDTSYRILSSAQRIYVGRLQTYFHYYREDSISHQKFSEKQYFFFEAMEHNRKYLEKNFKGNKKIWRAFEYMYAIGGLQIIDLMLLDDRDSESKNYRNKITKYFFSVVFNFKIGFKQRLKYSLFVFNGKLYKIILNLVK